MNMNLIKMKNFELEYWHEMDEGYRKMWKQTHKAYINALKDYAELKNRIIK